MKREIRTFFTALMFFTRIPCPSWINHSPSYLNRSSRYFPLIGAIVGASGAATYMLTSMVFEHAVAVLLSMATTIVVTGAFHEDGLADVCDGFGGGWNKKDILRIMKDSRVGTYGVVGLALTLGLKFLVLLHIPGADMPYILIAGHAVSRMVAGTLLYTHPYARDGETADKPTAGPMSTWSFVIAVATGLAAFAFFDLNALICLAPLFLLRWYLGSYFNKWIGGHTGDCSGAVQQWSEVLFYASMTTLWKFA